MTHKQETPLQTFWPVLIIPIAIVEVFSVFSFTSPFGGELWSIRSDFENGNFGFDPMGLRPESAEEYKEMQTKVRVTQRNERRWRRWRRHGNREERIWPSHRSSCPFFTLPLSLRLVLRRSSTTGG